MLITILHTGSICWLRDPSATLTQGRNIAALPSSIEAAPFLPVTKVGTPQQWFPSQWHPDAQPPSVLLCFGSESYLSPSPMEELKCPPEIGKLSSHLIGHPSSVMRRLLTALWPAPSKAPLQAFGQWLWDCEFKASDINSLKLLRSVWHSFIVWYSCNYRSPHLGQPDKVVVLSTLVACQQVILHSTTCIPNNTGKIFCPGRAADHWPKTFIIWTDKCQNRQGKIIITSVEELKQNFGTYSFSLAPLVF